MKTYKVGLVGESKFQDAVAQCAVGQSVEILHEVENPFDGLALRVDVAGKTIGYIGRDNFLRSAIHDEGYGVIATIAAVEGKYPTRGVVLDAQLDFDSFIETASYRTA